MNATTSVGTRKTDAHTSTTDKASSPIENEAQQLSPKDSPESIYYEPPGFVKKAEPPPSPTQITLLLKAQAGAFDNFPAVAEEVGFRHPQRRGPIFQLGLISHDTLALIASVHYKQWDHFERRLNMAEVRVDPENCEPELDAGWRLFDHLHALAKHLNATICDGLGTPLDAATRADLAAHIDTVMKRRVNAARKKSAIELEDGSLRLPGPVSFQTVTYEKKPGKPRSRTPKHNHFDVPALTYSAAHAKAYRMVEELQRTFDEHKVERPYLPYLLAEALGAPTPRLDFGGKKGSRENVVAVFLEILHRVLANGLANTNPKWLAQQAALYEGFVERDAQRAAEAKKAFSERMRSAKAANKAGQQGGAA
jgi:hypothetical protein